MSRIGFLILLALFECSPVSAESAGTKIGNVTVELVAPPGLCKLNSNNPADNWLLTTSEKALAGRNRLLALFADCKELDEWRDHRRPLLDHTISYQTPLKTSGVDIPTAPGPFIKQSCEQMRQQSKTFDAKTSDLNARLEASMVGIKLNEQRTLGVLDEEPSVCYYGLIQKILAQTGTEKTAVSIIAGTLLKGKIVFLKLTAPYEGAASAAQLLEMQKKAMAAFLLANPA